MRHRVFGQLTKKYSVRGCDVYCSEHDIWVIMANDFVIGFTWAGYNGYDDVKGNINKTIDDYSRMTS